MRCERCKGEEATVHVKNLTMGDKDLCPVCAADDLYHLDKQRYSLAAALGYNTVPDRAYDNTPIDITPVFRVLVNEVKLLVEMRATLNRFRRFMRDET